MSNDTILGKVKQATPDFYRKMVKRKKKKTSEFMPGVNVSVNNKVIKVIIPSYERRDNECGLLLENAIISSTIEPIVVYFAGIR